MPIIRHTNTMTMSTEALEDGVLLPNIISFVSSMEIDDGFDVDWEVFASPMLLYACIAKSVIFNVEAHFSEINGHKNIFN